MMASDNVVLEMQVVSGPSAQTNALRILGENLGIVIPDTPSSSSESGQRESSQMSENSYRASTPTPPFSPVPMVGGKRKDTKLNNGKREEEWTRFAGALNDYDRTIMDAGKDSIDSLLVFAGLFSAVVTAFCIVSLALLQPDPIDAAVVILSQISQQLGSLSIDAGHITSIQPLYTPPARFRATTPQIAVNILWFSSLVLALISASLGIIVKQWLREYVATTSSQPMQHVCIRQFRFDGLRRWRVNAIMRLLPLFLQLSLLLFFAGLSTLFWTISTPVAAVGTVLVSIWLTFWLTSICLPTFYPDCPYKSAESTIFFALVQSAKPVLHSGVRWLAHHIYTHVQRFEKLGTLFLDLKNINSHSYDSWRDREKDVVQQDMENLSLRTLKGAEEILMDEPILEVAMGAYVRGLDFHGSVEFFLDRFSKVAGCGQEELRKWAPDGSRRTLCLIRLAMDTLMDADMPFHNPRFLFRTSPEVLIDIFGNYLNYQAGRIQAKEVIQGLLDLPSRVDLLGVSSKSLGHFTRRLLRMQSPEFVVKVEAIDNIARCAVYAYNSNPKDHIRFLAQCKDLIELLIHPSVDEIALHVGHVLIALGKVATILKTNSHQTSIQTPMVDMAIAIYALVERHPALKPDMHECVTELLKLQTDPPPDTPPLQYEYSWRAQIHRNALNALWGLYNDCPPPPSPLLPSDGIEKNSDIMDSATQFVIPSPPSP